MSVFLFPLLQQSLGRLRRRLSHTARYCHYWFNGRNNKQKTDEIVVEAKGILQVRAVPEDSAIDFAGHAAILLFCLDITSVCARTHTRIHTKPKNKWCSWRGFYLGEGGCKPLIEYERRSKSAAKNLLCPTVACKPSNLCVCSGGIYVAHKRPNAS